MSTHARSLVSEAEFLALPVSNQRIELIDGEVVVAPSPSYWHQEVLARILDALRSWAASSSTEATVVQAPLDIRFKPGRVLQPDGVVFLTKLERDVPTPIDRVPELCIEVLSSDRTYDRITKRFIYAEAGVQEYWIVDPAGVVERRTGAGLAREDVVSERLTTALLPGFELDLKQLFS